MNEETLKKIKKNEVILMWKTNKEASAGVLATKLPTHQVKQLFWESIRKVSYDRS